MPEQVRPAIVVSRCLEFDSCRWNGEVIDSPVVRILMDWIDFISVCPEMEIGLGVPRDPIRVEAPYRLVQPARGRDVSPIMREFAASFLERHKEVDGFILKSASPSCGIRRVKLHSSIDGGRLPGSTRGFFAGAVLDHYPTLPVEDEIRLNRPHILWSFLVRIHALAAFREVRKSGTIEDLAGYHSDNELLLMVCSRKHARLLGRMVVNRERLPVGEVLDLYQVQLRIALSRLSRKVARIDTHPADPLSVISPDWIESFDLAKLTRQTLFHPFPEGITGPWRAR